MHNRLDAFFSLPLNLFSLSTAVYPTGLTPFSIFVYMVAVLRKAPSVIPMNSFPFIFIAFHVHGVL